MRCLALERRLTEELPDVYVFRYSEPPTVRLDDAAGRQMVEAQWERVKAFGRWFLTAGQSRLPDVQLDR